jgi:hypothetical protein
MLYKILYGDYATLQEDIFRTRNAQVSGPSPDTGSRDSKGSGEFNLNPFLFPCRPLAVFKASFFSINYVAPLYASYNLMSDVEGYNFSGFSLGTEISFYF